MTKPTEVANPKAARISAAAFTLAEQKRNTFFCAPAVGTDPKDMLNPAYWAHVAAQLRPLDRIEAMCEDGSWYQELLVTYAGNVAARVVSLRVVNLEDADTSETEEYEIKFGGAVDLHRIIRKSDNAVMGKGYRTKADAMAFLQTLLPKAA